MRKSVIALIALALVNCRQDVAKSRQPSASSTNQNTSSAPVSRVNFSESDWEFIGPSQTMGDQTVCFVDKNSTQWLPDNHFKAWIKCLADVDMNLTDKVVEADLVNQAAHKILDGYIPIYVRQNMPKNKTDSKNLVAELTMDELIANKSGVDPTMRIFIEIDCKAKNSRLLRADMPKKGEKGTGRPTDWEPIPPDSLAHELGGLNCVV